MKSKILKLSGNEFSRLLLEIQLQFYSALRSKDVAKDIREKYLLVGEQFWI